MRHGLTTQLAAAAIVAAAFAFLPAEAVGEPLRSLYGDIARKACRNPNPKPAAQLGEHETVVYNCPVSAGFAATVRYYGAQAGLDLRPKGDKAYGGEIRAPHDFGDKIEWRGASGPKGFAPRAAIVRVIIRDGDTTTSSALAVLKVEHDRLCNAAYVNGAEPDANAVARREADAATASFRCGRDKPRVVGKLTPGLRDIVDLAR